MCGFLLSIESVGMSRDVAEQMQCIGREPRLARRGFDRPVAQAPCIVESAEHQRSATQPMIEYSEGADVPACSVMVDKLLAIAKPALSLCRLVELRQDPGGADNRLEKHKVDAPCSEHRARMLEPWT